MNNMLKSGLLTLGLGIAFCPTDAGAALVNHTAFSNAVNHCQAFTPGPSNTIRNRVIGSENIGDPIAVACNFTTLLNGAPGNTNITSVAIFFTNNSGVPASVTCTLLTGTSAGIAGAGVTYAVAKSTPAIAAGGASSVLWTTADNPTPGATDMGNLLVGVNCTLPTSVIMSATRVIWTADNGV